MQYWHHNCSRLRYCIPVVDWKISWKKLFQVRYFFANQQKLHSLHSISVTMSSWHILINGSVYVATSPSVKWKTLKATLKIFWACCNAPLPKSCVMWFSLQQEVLYHNNSVPSLPDVISKWSLCSPFPSSILVYRENLSFWWLPIQLSSS